jgi:hypothetical protein
MKKTKYTIEMEPEWTKNISSEVVCNFFYFFYVIYAVFAIFAVFSLVALMFMDLPKNMLVMASVQSLLMLGVAGTTALFHYLVCARALLPSIGAMRRDY